jgi:hypothetical protein
MQITAISGVQQITDGQINTVALRGDKQGALNVSELNPRYYENAYRGKSFFGSNGAVPTVTTVALATTYTGLVLINPANSGVNAVLDKVGLSFLVAFPAASTIGLMVGWAAAGITTFGAAATVAASSLVGSGLTGKCSCALSATLVGTPVLHTVFGSGLTGAITTTPVTAELFDMEGSCIIPPGGYAAIYTSTVSGAASLAASFHWTELPV